MNYVPNISKWNTNKVKDMCYLFYECKSLISLPNISKLVSKNIQNIKYMFYGCNSLVSLSDISKWNTVNITDMSYLFLRLWLFIFITRYIKMEYF